MHPCSLITISMEFQSKSAVRWRSPSTTCLVNIFVLEEEADCRVVLPDSTLSGWLGCGMWDVGRVVSCMFGSVLAGVAEPTLHHISSLQITSYHIREIIQKYRGRTGGEILNQRIKQEKINAVFYAVFLSPFLPLVGRQLLTLPGPVLPPLFLFINPVFLFHVPLFLMWSHDSPLFVRDTLVICA